MNVFVLPLSRILLSLVFIYGGYGKVFGGMEGFKTWVAGLLQNSPMPDLAQYASILAQVGAYVEFAGGILLFLGVLSRVAAFALLIFTVLASVLAHNFWAFADAKMFAEQLSVFLKNMGLVGGLLLIVGAGGGAVGVDGMFRRPQ
jgi:putative oxidoreductase